MAVIINRKVANTVLCYATISERIICLKLQRMYHNMEIIQIYAPKEIAEQTEKAQFYEELTETIKEHKKSRDQLIVMRDFNAKVGKTTDKKVVGPYGMGDRNENGDLLIDFCREEELIVTNTWFEQKTLKKDVHGCHLMGNQRTK